MGPRNFGDIGEPKCYFTRKTICLKIDVHLISQVGLWSWNMLRYCFVDLSDISKYVLLWTIAEYPGVNVPIFLIFLLLDFFCFSVLYRFEMMLQQIPFLPAKFLGKTH